MKYRYRVRFVGNDSLEHRMVVWAENRRLAAEAARRSGADFVLSVKSDSGFWIWTALMIVVLVVLLACI